MKTCLSILVLLSVSALSAFGGQEAWDKDIGKPAPGLVPAAWLGTPVSLEHVRGNTVLIAFWNADVAC
jgi:hypothetical protein